MADDWLQRGVVAGLSGLVALRLDGAPAADAITHTLDIWLVALSKGRIWDEEQDSWRINSAFKTLFATCERWPAPARLLRELPPRKEPLVLPRPVKTDEQRAGIQSHIDNILERLRPRTTKPETNTEQQT